MQGTTYDPLSRIQVTSLPYTQGWLTHCVKEHVPTLTNLKTSQEKLRFLLSWKKIKQHEVYSFMEHYQNGWAWALWLVLHRCFHSTLVQCNLVHSYLSGPDKHLSFQTLVCIFNSSQGTLYYCQSQAYFLDLGI